jgi:hypothetical protein
MRNTGDVVVQHPTTDEPLVMIGIDRSSNRTSKFVRIDWNGETYYLGPKIARKIAASLTEHADQIRPEDKKRPAVLGGSRPV